MKKNLFFGMLCAIALAFGMTSCKTTKPGVDYTLNVDGDGDGNVMFTFPVGQFAMNGKADLALLVTNDTVTLDTTKITTKADVLASGDEAQIEALRAVNQFVATQVEAEQVDAADSTAAGGTYYFHVKGFVKERLTGLVFAVDREFTNRSETQAPGRGATVTTNDDDEFKYVL